MNLLNLLSEYKEYSDFCAAIKKGTMPISVAGVCESATAQFVAETANGKKALCICSVSDYLLDMSLNMDADSRRTAFTKMMEVALEIAEE